MAGAQVEFLGGHKDNENWHLKFKLDRKQYLYDPLNKTWLNRDILAASHFSAWSAPSVEVPSELSGQTDHYVNGSWAYLGVTRGFHHLYYVTAPAEDTSRHIFLEPAFPDAHYYSLDDEDLQGLQTEELTFEEVKEACVEGECKIDIQVDEVFAKEQLTALVSSLGVAELTEGNFKCTGKNEDGFIYFEMINKDGAHGATDFRFNPEEKTWEQKSSLGSTERWESTSEAILQTAYSELITLKNRVIEVENTNNQMPYWAVMLIAAVVVFAILLAVTAFGAFLPAASPFFAILKTGVTAILNFVTLPVPNLAVPGILFGVTAALEFAAVAVAAVIAIGLAAVGRALFGSSSVNVPASAAPVKQPEPRMQEEKEEPKQPAYTEQQQAVSEAAAASGGEADAAQVLPELPARGWVLNQTGNDWYIFKSDSYHVHIDKARGVLIDKIGEDGAAVGARILDFSFAELPHTIRSQFYIKTQIEVTRWQHSHVRDDGVYIYKPSGDGQDTREIRIMPGQRGWVRFVTDATSEDQGELIIFNQLPTALRQLHQSTRAGQAAVANTGASGEADGLDSDALKLVGVLKGLGYGSDSEASPEPVHKAPTSANTGVNAHNSDAMAAVDERRERLEEVDQATEGSPSVKDRAAMFGSTVNGDGG